MFKTGLVARLNNWWFGMFHFPGGWSESDFYQSSKMNNRGQKIFISSYTFLTHTHTHTPFTFPLCLGFAYLFSCVSFSFFQLVFFIPMSLSFLLSFCHSVLFLLYFLSLSVYFFVLPLFFSLARWELSQVLEMS